MTEEKKEEKKEEDIEIAEVVAEEKVKSQPVCWQRLKDRMVYIYGILMLDLIVVCSSYEVYNSQLMGENKGWQEMFLIFYKITLLGGVAATLSIICDADHGPKAAFLICYAVGIFCCLVMAVLPFLFYFLYTCYTTVVPWLNSGQLGRVLQVIWGLTVPPPSPPSS